MSEFVPSSIELREISSSSASTLLLTDDAELFNRGNGTSPRVCVDPYKRNAEIFELIPQS
jgi:hypothetical protein